MARHPFQGGLDSLRAQQRANRRRSFRVGDGSVSARNQAGDQAAPGGVTQIGGGDFAGGLQSV